MDTVGCSRGKLPTGPKQDDSACSMQCTDNANEFCGAGNLNSVYIIPGAGVGKGSCQARCPGSVSGLPFQYSETDLNDGQLFCDYEDYNTNRAYACTFNLVSMHP
jgi:hypothetical protein